MADNDSMRIEGSNSALTNLRNAPKVGSGQTAEGQAARKTLGEMPPVRVPLDQLSSSLAALFAKGGLVDRLRRKLNRLKKKKCKVIPAKGTIACVDENDVVFLGVDFLEAYQNQEDVIAGVMAHEWGHTCAFRPESEEVQEMNWDEIFELRRAHEVLADEISGRLLALLGFKPDGLVDFLSKDGDKTHNLKYHSAKVRAQIIREGHADEKRKIEFAKDLFAGGLYANDHTSQLIDEDV